MKRLITTIVIAFLIITALPASTRTEGVFFGHEAAAFSGDGFDHEPLSRWERERAFGMGVDLRFGVWQLYLDIPFGYAYHYAPSEGYYSTSHTLYLMPSANIELFGISWFGFSVGAGVDMSMTYRFHEWTMKGNPVAAGSMRLFYRAAITVDLSAVVIDFALSLPTRGTFGAPDYVPDMSNARASLGFLFPLV